MDEHPSSKLLRSLKAATSKALEVTRQLAMPSDNLPNCNQLGLMDFKDEYDEVKFSNLKCKTCVDGWS
uniref:Uncharacterized protein n=1 Tax=Romanomermis culicivorax TaxID=13658 RepID=A0A915JRY9_ROMCU